MRDTETNIFGNMHPEFKTHFFMPSKIAPRNFVSTKQTPNMLMSN